MSEKVLIASFEFILESATLIEKWFEEIAHPDDYVASSLGKSHYDATLMRLQSIGETLKKIDRTQPDLLAKYKNTRWNDIIRLREIISHHYEQLSQEIIYDICKNDLPALRKDVQQILTGLTG